MSLITPREPVIAERFAQERFIATQQARQLRRWSELVVAAASSCGDRHAVNEDSHSDVSDGHAPVFIVADGVGGGVMAAWVSRHVVRRVQAALGKGRIDAQAVRNALLEADRDVARRVAKRTTGSGAATVALCAGTGSLLARWFIGWVGDCRVYRLAKADGETPELITRDDTYRNLGESPPAGGSPDDPARMVGNGAVGDPCVERIELGSGEALLLCSDGVYKHVSSDDMRQALATSEPLARRCMRLIEVAREHGSIDDATVLVVRRVARPRAALWKYACIGALALLFAVMLFAAASDATAARPLVTATDVQSNLCREHELEH